MVSVTKTTQLRSRLKSNNLPVWLQKLFLISFGVIGLSIASHLSIPLKPVPITLQTYAVLFIGMCFGSRLGTLTVLSYLILGISGAPFFAAATSYLTAGYLVGFLFAAGVSGYLIENGMGKTRLLALLAAMIGMAIIYLFGLAFLSYHLGFKMSLAVGFLPFIPVMIAKIILLGLTMPTFWTSK